MAITQRVGRKINVNVEKSMGPRIEKYQCRIEIELTFPAEPAHRKNQCGKKINVGKSMGLRIEKYQCALTLN